MKKPKKRKKRRKPCENCGTNMRRKIYYACPNCWVTSRFS